LLDMCMVIMLSPENQRISTGYPDLAFWSTPRLEPYLSDQSIWEFYCPRSRYGVRGTQRMVVSSGLRQGAVPC
jgi:hypothetical protein